MSLVSAFGVEKRFGSLPVLRNVSLSVVAGALKKKIGPSGCGKTTLLRILHGLETSDAGTVEAAPRAGYLPQDGLLLPWKTVLANAELPLELRGVSAAERRTRIQEALPAFGLDGFEKAYPHELSGGMRQRAALLRAVLTGSPILILDEPFGALDTLTRHRLQEWLADTIRRLARAMLFVTHDLEEAVVLSERLVLLSPRPAVVLGESRVSLSAEERRNRLGLAFLATRDRALALLTA